MAKFSEIDTSYFDFRSISAKSFKMIDEELKVYKHKVSFEKDLINNRYQNVLEKIKDFLQVRSKSYFRVSIRK